MIRHLSCHSWPQFSVSHNWASLTFILKSLSTSAYIWWYLITIPTSEPVKDIICITWHDPEFNHILTRTYYEGFLSNLCKYWFPKHQYLVLFWKKILRFILFLWSDRTFRSSIEFAWLIIQTNKSNFIVSCSIKQWSVFVSCKNQMSFRLKHRLEEIFA